MNPTKLDKPLNQPTVERREVNVDEGLSDLSEFSLGEPFWRYLQGFQLPGLYKAPVRFERVHCRTCSD